MQLIRLTKITLPAGSLEPDFYIRSDTVLRIGKTTYGTTDYRLLLTSDAQSIIVTESAADIARAINAALP